LSGVGVVVTASETPLATVAWESPANWRNETRHLTADAVKRLPSLRRLSLSDAASGAAAGVSFDETQKIRDRDAMTQINRAGWQGVTELLAKGEVDIGLTFISEIITERGRGLVCCREIFHANGSGGICLRAFERARSSQGALTFSSASEAAAVYSAERE
jgi:hypothetical protein